MASFNKVYLMGNLTRDPQLRTIPSSQTTVCDFGLACNRKFKGQNGEDREEVTFVDVSAFGRTAEVIAQYLTKGKPIFIEGRLKYDQWEDKNGGGKRSKLAVVCENFQFIGGRDDGQGGGGGGGGGGSYRGGGAQFDPEGHGGGGGGGEYDQRPPARSQPPQSRGPAPSRGPVRPAAPPVEQPFDDQPQVDDGDIPF